MGVRPAVGHAFNRSRGVDLAAKMAVADTFWTRLRGLLGRSPDDFGNSAGLWIVPCHGVHTLGMAFPIDVVYLGCDLTVIHIESDLPPWRIAPIHRKAASVLELPSGTASKTKTQIGDTIEITLPARSTIPS